MRLDAGFAVPQPQLAEVIDEAIDNLGTAQFDESFVDRIRDAGLANSGTAAST
ncbi:MAG: hypothetical protein JWQ24_3600 [Tardiphaga sp.]|nr:hypothetical protein [Tardiphaga sp.]